MSFDADRWRHILADCGVTIRRRTDFAPAFAAYVTPSAFTAGERAFPDFLGQVLHESGGLNYLEEDLSYSSARLMLVWPARFPDVATARQYAYQPERLANLVYGDRLGNNQPGDGWRYRGRSPLQVTGRSNYERVARLTGLPIVSNPDLLLRPSEGLRAAVAMWGLLVPDWAIGNLLAVSRAINCGNARSAVQPVGFTDRVRSTERARIALAKPMTEPKSAVLGASPKA